MLERSHKIVWNNELKPIEDRWMVSEILCCVYRRHMLHCVFGRFIQVAYCLYTLYRTSALIIAH